MSEVSGDEEEDEQETFAKHTTDSLSTHSYDNKSLKPVSYWSGFAFTKTSLSLNQYAWAPKDECVIISAWYSLFITNTANAYTRATYGNQTIIWRQIWGILSPPSFWIIFGMRSCSVLASENSRHIYTIENKTTDLRRRRQLVGVPVLGILCIHKFTHIR